MQRQATDLPWRDIAHLTFHRGAKIWLSSWYVSVSGWLIWQEDDYSYIMAEALADRLAEAFAEVLHKITRRELWGYAADEQLSSDDLLKVKYQGTSSPLPPSPPSPPRSLQGP